MAKIQTIKNNGEIIYPRTVAGAVVMPDGETTVAEELTDTVKVIEQTFNDTEKTQARANIGITLHDDVQDVTPDPPISVSYGQVGVISQTQRWTQASDRGYDYTMSNQVRGLIPQANIDLFESAGATFNANTGYFELNGLTDLSYKEMLGAYIKANLSNAAKGVVNFLQGSTQRTNISTWEGSWNQKLNCNQLFYISLLEAIEYKSTSGSNYTNADCRYMFGGNGKLRKIGTLNMTDTTTVNGMFMQCYSLEDVSIKGLKVNISLSDSSRLTAASVAYMVANAGTATITITLHATAYARAAADANVQAALATKTNVTLASA
jgi:hypothetical protein